MLSAETAVLHFPSLALSVAILNEKQCVVVPAHKLHSNDGKLWLTFELCIRDKCFVPVLVQIVSLCGYFEHLTCIEEACLFSTITVILAHIPNIPAQNLFLKKKIAFSQAALLCFTFAGLVFYDADGDAN